MESATTVRVFGSLHSIRKERGLPSTFVVDIPAEGCTGRALAQRLELPLSKVEAIFINHRAHRLNDVIRRGDRVAFIPTGIPSPERLLLGISRPAPGTIH